MAKKRSEALIEVEENEIIEELADDVTSQEEQSEEALIKKFNEENGGIIIQRNDFLVPNLLELVDDGHVLNLHPSYQRRIRWGNKKKSLLIESLLMNIPIPPIFLYEKEYARYEVMDGQQRLDTIRGFFRNEFKLEGLKEWEQLNGKNYETLPLIIQQAIRRRGLASVIILTESGRGEAGSFKLRQYVFERLNTGGEKLNSQEIRNCIYSGNFNDAIIRIARSNEFVKAWGIPPRESGEPDFISDQLRQNKLYSTMSDCEIVLRFFAFREMNKFQGSVKKTLDFCMDSNKNISPEDADNLVKEYLDLLKTAFGIFEESLFKLPNKNKELLGRRSIPLSDAVLIALSKIEKSKRQQLKKSKNQIVEETKKALIEDKAKYETLVGKGNTKKAIEDRLDLMRSIFLKLI